MKYFTPPRLAKVAPVLALLYVMVLFYALLYPFQFSPPNSNTLLFSFKLNAEGWPILIKNSNKKDVMQNIVLFVPLGFFLFAWAQRQIQRSALAIILIVIFAGLVSVVCEALQFFEPARWSAIFDVGANVIGAAVGATSCWFSFLLAEKLGRTKELA